MHAVLAAAQAATQASTWTKTGLDSIVAGDGLAISVVGILVVFASLTLMAFVITLIKRLASPRKTQSASADTPAKNGISGEVVAAIAIALEEHLFELHDEERTILTISKVSRPYSPWSSKLHGMTPQPFTQTLR